MNLPDSVLRAVVQQVIGFRSLREVAGEIGIVPSAVLKFLEGATPQKRTRRKLLAWYARESPALPEPTPEVALAVLDMLLQGLTPERQARVRESFLADVEAEHREQGTPPPRWLADPETE